MLTVRRSIPGVVLALTLTGIGSAAVDAQPPIQPHHRFGGVVNRRSNKSVIGSVCAGPGALGRVAKNQTMDVVGDGHGNTGSSHYVYAWIVPSSPARTPPMITFDAFFRPTTISTSWRVPCTGTGEVEFSSCAYGQTCSSGSVPVYVKVTFKNTAT
jgi:hypothetical protein